MASYEDVGRSVLDGATTSKQLPATPSYEDVGRTILDGQSLTAGGTSPVARSMGRDISEDQIPGPIVQGAISMATDPEQRRRIAAAQLFPGMPPLEAQSRVFYGPNGRMAAVGADGKAFWVDPGFWGPDIFHPSRIIPDNLLARAGTMLGPALGVTGAVGAGLATAPESLVAGPVLAAGGAAAGDLLRQTIARQLDPGITGPAGGLPTPQPYNLGETAGEAIGTGAGQLVGGAALRLRPGYNPLGANPLDVKALRDPAVQQAAADAYARAQAQGVNLTPGQASRLPSLLNAEDVFASGTAGGDSANVAAKFYEGQRNQLTGAFDRAQGGVSSAADKTDAALQFQQGAEDAQRIVRQQANAAAKPSYDAAKAGGQVMSPDLAQLSDVPAVKTALDAARKEYPNMPDTRGMVAPDSPDFQLWDLTKRKLDDAYTIAKRAGENTTAMAIDSLRKDLLTHLDAAYPTYAAARATAAPGLREAAILQDVVGKGGELGTEKLRAILNPVFESSNPRAISAARDSFVKAGKEDEWNAGTRAYVQDLFDKTIQSKEGLNPAYLRRQLWSDPNKRAALQAAMDPAAFDGFENFMRTVEDVAQSKGANSFTAPRQAGAAELRETAANSPAAKAVGFLSTLLSPQDLVRIAKSGGTMLQNWMTSRNMAKIGERLFSPEGQEYLRSMANAPKGSPVIAATARFLGQQGGAFVTAPPPPLPNALEMTPP